MGKLWSDQMFAAVLPPSKVANVRDSHRDMVGAQLVRATWMRSGNLNSLIARVKCSYALLDDAFDKAPADLASIVEATFQRLGELQQREFSLARDAERASKDDLEKRFGAYLDLYEFTYEHFYRTLSAPYVAADCLSRTTEPFAPLIDMDGRVRPSRMEKIEAERRIKTGTLSEGLNNHLRNSAAHHRYSILDDDRIRLWDVNAQSHYTWGPVEWKFWDFRTNIYLLSNTCVVLLLGLGLFDISHHKTILGRGWGKLELPPRKRRDVVKGELLAVAARVGFDVIGVKRQSESAIEIELRVKGDTMIDQLTQIVAGGGSGPTHSFVQQIRTVWSPLRDQVYAFVQGTFDAHGGYDLIRLKVVADDGKTSLGEIEAPLAIRQLMLEGKKKAPVDVIRSRLPVDTLADQQIPIVLKGPVIPAS